MNPRLSIFWAWTCWTGGPQFNTRLDLRQVLSSFSSFSSSSRVQRGLLRQRQQQGLVCLLYIFIDNLLDTSYQSIHPSRSKVAWWCLFSETTDRLEHTPSHSPSHSPLSLVCPYSIRTCSLLYMPYSYATVPYTILSCGVTSLDARRPG